MSNEPQTPPTPPQTPPPGETPPETKTPVETPPQKTLEEQLAEAKADADKWKNLSRTNEDRYKEASKERDELKQAQMTDAEKALETARTEGRNSALSEFGTDLAKAEMVAAAFKAGVQLPDTQYLNVQGFLGADGRPNKEAIETFVSSLPKSTPEFPQLRGAGASNGGSGEFTSMDPDELAKYIAGDTFI